MPVVPSRRMRIVLAWIASDASGVPVAIVGTLHQPLTIELRAETGGPLPALPGQSPPPRCDLRDDLERRP